MISRVTTVAVFCTLALTSPLEAQFPPDSLVNLQVLPEDTDVRELIGVMRGFALVLGVRCQYCHVGEEGMPLSEFDFPSDEKANKRKARVMLEMMGQINTGALADLPERSTPHVQVECASCHRGQARPRMIEDVLVQTIEEEGIDAAKANYRELREQYYGSYTFDFSEFTLSLLAQDLIGGGEFDNAVGALELNLEFFPNSGGIHFMLGEAYRAKGDSDQAIAEYERALELQPDLRQAQMRLTQLRGN
jgi:hypothetical protein